MYRKGGRDQVSLMLICPVCGEELDEETIRMATLDALMDDGRTTGDVTFGMECDECGTDLHFAVSVRISIVGDQPIVLEGVKL